MKTLKSNLKKIAETTVQKIVALLNYRKFPLF